MYAIAAVGLLTVVFSTLMAASPERWSSGIITFAAKPYFHIAEISSRLLLGLVLLIFAGSTLYPTFITIVGGVFLFAGVFLIFAGPRRHREFAVRSAGFKKVFRPAGIAGAAFGTFIIYTALAA